MILRLSASSLPYHDAIPTGTAVGLASRLTTCIAAFGMPCYRIHSRIDQSGIPCIAGVHAQPTVNLRGATGFPHAASPVPRATTSFRIGSTGPDGARSVLWHFLLLLAASFSAPAAASPEPPGHLLLPSNSRERFRPMRPLAAIIMYILVCASYETFSSAASCATVSGVPTLLVAAQNLFPYPPARYSTQRRLPVRTPAGSVCQKQTSVEIFNASDKPQARGQSHGSRSRHVRRRQYPVLLQFLDRLLRPVPTRTDIHSLIANCHTLAITSAVSSVVHGVSNTPYKQNRWRPSLRTPSGSITCSRHTCNMRGYFRASAPETNFRQFGGDLRLSRAV